MRRWKVYLKQKSFARNEVFVDAESLEAAYVVARRWGRTIVTIQTASPRIVDQLQIWWDVHNPVKMVTRRMIVAVAIAAALTLTVSLFAMYVWPTRYRYEPMTFGGFHSLARIDRLTGDTYILAPGYKWQHVPEATQ